MNHLLALPLAPRPMTLDFTGTMPDDPSLDANSFKLTLEARNIHRWDVTVSHKDPVACVAFKELDEDEFEWCNGNVVKFNYERHKRDINFLVSKALQKALNPWLSLNDAFKKGMDVEVVNEWLVCYKDWKPRYLYDFREVPLYLEKAKAGDNVGFMPVSWANPDVLEACKRIEIYRP